MWNLARWAVQCLVRDAGVPSFATCSPSMRAACEPVHSHLDIEAVHSTSPGRLSCVAPMPAWALLLLSLIAACPSPCLCRILSRGPDEVEDRSQFTQQTVYEVSPFRQHRDRAFGAADATTLRRLHVAGEVAQVSADATPLQPAHLVTKGRSTLYSSNLFTCLTRCHPAQPLQAHADTPT